MWEAYSHEVSSCGYWPGPPGREGVFYVYAYPEPPGYRDAAVAPAGARWDDDLGGKDYEERDGRKTVLVTGRPEGKAVPRREASVAPTARQRRQTPTRARLAGRPDRVALWAVALGLVMAAMAGFTGNGHAAHSSHGADLPAPAPLTSR